MARMEGLASILLLLCSGAVAGWPSAAHEVHAQGVEGATLRIEHVVDLIPSTQVEAGIPFAALALRDGYALLTSSPTKPLRLFDRMGAEVALPTATLEIVKGPVALASGNGGEWWLYDAIQEQLIALSSDGTIMTTASLKEPQMVQMLVFRGRPFLISAVADEPDRFGLPFHRLDLRASGARVLQSFGRDARAEVALGEMHLLVRLVAPSGVAAERFWAVSPFDYIVERFTISGVRERTFRRDAVWFAGGTRGGVGSPDSPPPTAIAGIAETPSGKVMVLGLVPDSGWMRAWDGVAIADDGSIPLAALDRSRLLDTVVELLDPDSGELIGSGTLDGFGFAALEGGQLITWDPGPVSRGRVWRVSVRSGP